MWKILVTTEFETWHLTLADNEKIALSNVLALLEHRGPVLGRPHVDRVESSRFHNMKEIRLSNGIRVFFAFDPRRSAVLLIGGNKSESESSSPNWNRFYERMIPVADQIFAEHLLTLGEEK
jgi:hypothetical protein